MNPAIKNKILEVMLSEPSLTQREVADRVGVHESIVSRAVSSLTKGNDYQIAMKAAGRFIQAFVNTTEFWKLQITQLERMKGETDDVELRIKIMKEQSERYEKILFQARQGELVEGLRLINKGMIPLKNKEKGLPHNIKKTI